MPTLYIGVVRLVGALQLTDTAAGGKGFKSKLRWKRKVSSVANHGTGNKRGGRTAAAAAPPAGPGAVDTGPDWVQGIGGE